VCAQEKYKMKEPNTVLGTNSYESIR